MKRIKTKLKDIITYENIVNAYFDSLKNKKNRAETFVVDLTLSTVLNSIYDELSSDSLCVFLPFFAQIENYFPQPAQLRDFFV